MLGAGVFVLAEELLSVYTEQWQLVIGVVFVLFVLFVPRGLVSLPATLARRVDRVDEGEPPLGVDEPEPEVKSDD
jgi:branched-chain amino acid transport system permease protein